MRLGLIGGQASELREGALQDFLQEFLFLLAEFLSALRQIKDVDGFLAFRVDQRDVDVATKPG